MMIIHFFSIFKAVGFLISLPGNGF